MFEKGQTVWVDTGVEERPAVVTIPDEGGELTSVKFADAVRSTVVRTEWVRERDPRIPQRRKVTEFVPARALLPEEREIDRRRAAQQLRAEVNNYFFRAGRMEFIR